MKVWTYFYNPLTMGGNCYTPTGFEKELDNEVNLGGGYKGYEVTTPKGNMIIVEKTSGAIVGKSLQEVRNDIATASADIMANQVSDALATSNKVKIISEEAFWKVYKS